MKFLESNISTAMSIHSNSGLLESSAILRPKSPAILGKVPGIHLCAQGSHNEREPVPYLLAAGQISQFT
jgi:hypothetical protein